MWEYIVTFVIVGVVLALALRSFYRTIKHGKTSCACASAKDGCSANSSCQQQQKIVRISTR